MNNLILKDLSTAAVEYYNTIKREKYNYLDAKGILFNSIRRNNYNLLQSVSYKSFTFDSFLIELNTLNNHVLTLALKKYSVPGDKEIRKDFFGIPLSEVRKIFGWDSYELYNISICMQVRNTKGLIF